MRTAAGVAGLAIGGEPEEGSVKVAAGEYRQFLGWNVLPAVALTTLDFCVAAFQCEPCLGVVEVIDRPSPRDKLSVRALVLGVAGSTFRGCGSGLKHRGVIPAFGLNPRADLVVAVQALELARSVLFRMTDSAAPVETAVRF